MADGKSYEIHGAGGNVFWMLDALIMPNSALGQTKTGAMQR